MIIEQCTVVDGTEISQISPCAEQMSETVGSLGFGSRIRNVESGPAKQHIDLSNSKSREEVTIYNLIYNSPLQVKKLNEELKQKEEENENLKLKLAMAEEKSRQMEDNFVANMKREREVNIIQCHISIVISYMTYDVTILYF